MKLLRGISVLSAVLVSCGMLAGMALTLRQRALASEIVRLRVIGAGDSEKDQKIKLEVRDRLLEKMEDALPESVSEAKVLIEEEKNNWESDINAFLEQKGVSYRAKISFGRVEYPTCTYDTFSLPAGSYQACTVTLGKGEGHNWWCVLFPPLCYGLEAGDDIIEANGLIMRGEGDLEIRFKFRVLEWIQSVRETLKGR